MKKTKLMWLIIGVVFILSLINSYFYYTQTGNERLLLYLGDLLPVISALIGAISLFSTFKIFKEFEFPKYAWMLLFIGIALDFVAESTYAILELFNLADVKALNYTIADLFWCLAYIPLFIGLLVMIIGYRKSGFPMGKNMVYTLLTPLFLIITSLVFYLLLLPIIRDPETNVLAKFVYLYYPIGDLFTVVPAVILMYITSLFGKGKITKPWKYLAYGFILFTLADLIYSYLSWTEHYDNGNPIDIAWNLGYLFIGLAGLYQKELIESIKEGGLK